MNEPRKKNVKKEEKAENNININNENFYNYNKKEEINDEQKEKDDNY